MEKSTECAQPYTFKKRTQQKKLSAQHEQISVVRWSFSKQLCDSKEKKKNKKATQLFSLPLLGSC